MRTFVFHSVRSLDAWAGYLRTRESVLRKHYAAEGLLLLANTAGASVRALTDQLLASLQPLSLLPFKLDLLFEVRQLHHSLRRMGSHPQPDITSQQVSNVAYFRWRGFTKRLHEARLFLITEAVQLVWIVFGFYGTLHVFTSTHHSTLFTR
jgi:hypothetical protein